MHRPISAALLALALSVAGCDDASEVHTADDTQTSVAGRAQTTSDMPVPSTVAGAASSVSGSPTTSAIDASPTTVAASERLNFSEKGVGVGNFGDGQQLVQRGLEAILGPPDEVESLDTCWGKQVFLTWNDQLTLEFLRDELYGWRIDSDTLEGPRGVNVGDAAGDLIAAFDDYSSDVLMNDLSGAPELVLWVGNRENWFRATLSETPSDNGAKTLENIAGNWGSEWGRLFTVVDETPDLWCGD